MLELYFSCLLSIFVTTSYGSYLETLIFKKKSREIDISEEGLKGIIFLSFLALILNFFFSLNKDICTFIFILGMILGIKKKIYVNKTYLLSVSLVTFILLLYSNINRPDAGLYHLPITSIINESKIIIGSANIHFRFGHGSLVQYLSALHNVHFINVSFITIPLASVFSIFIFYLLKKFMFFFSNNNNFLVLLYFIFFVICIYSFNRYSGYGNDVISHIFYIYFYLKLTEYILEKKFSLDNFINLFLLSAFLISLKLFMIIAVLPIIYFVIKIYDKFNIFRDFRFYLISFFLFSLFLKSLLSSGCFLYPINYSCLKFLKIYDETKTLETSQVSEAWSKGWPDSKRNINFVEYNKNFNWIKTWSGHHLFFILEKIIPIIIFFGLIYIYLKIKLLRIDKGSTINNLIKNKGIIILFSYSIITALIWFLKFPLYRFGQSFLLSLMVLSFLISIQKTVKIINLEKIKRFFVFFILISILGFAYKNIKRIENNYNTNNLWPVVLTENKFQKIKVGDEGYFYFSNGKQCMYSKSPCTYYIPKDLKHQKIFSYDIYWIGA